MLGREHAADGVVLHAGIRKCPAESGNIQLPGMQHRQLDKIGSPAFENLDPRNVGIGKTGGNEEGVQTKSHCFKIGYLP
jgi:hypothetical protein